MENPAETEEVPNNGTKSNPAPDNDSQPTIEERFASLDGIIERMDEDDVPLEEAFSLYQSGLEQVKAANEMLDAMEKALLVMNESGDLEDFE